MKLDMAGGAAVLGALELAITRKAKANVAVIVAMSENNIDALSFRPGDVLQSLSGLTVEIADTDAEGRLALADAMAYGVREYAPSWLIDVATLTGQIVGTLHEEFAGLFASDDMLARALLDAGEETGDRLWRLPLDKSHDYLVESEQADIVNLGPAGLFGNGFGSPIAGAKFLERFTQGTKWAHIDMAGTAVASRATSSRSKGATGYGVRLLDRWLSSIETS
jgi:leucyl aminopeptidase